MQICFAHGPICRHWSCPSIAHLTSHPLTLQAAIIHRGILAATPAKLLHQQAQIYEARLSVFLVVFFLPRQLGSSVNSKAAVVGGQTRKICPTVQRDFTPGSPREEYHSSTWHAAQTPPPLMVRISIAESKRLLGSLFLLAGDQSAASDYQSRADTGSPCQAGPSCRAPVRPRGQRSRLT